MSMIMNLKRLSLVLFLLISFLAVPVSHAEEAQSGKLEWKPWSPAVFETAKKEKKLVILDLHAVWCHWCHVMEETTYSDPKVTELIRSQFLAVEADQDKNPDLSNRYEDYGWPATVIFNADGAELVKRRGYIEPEAMRSLLEAVIKDPVPGPSVEEEEAVKPSAQAFLTEEQKTAIHKEHLEFYDPQFGGWGKGHKLIDPDHLEYALSLAGKGDAEEEARARKTLDQALNLLDPVWGGFYQYSDERDWKSPHYEKIMWIQAYYTRLYSMAGALWKKPEYSNAAEKTAEYLKNFWQDSGGAFYTSQDADVSSEIPGKVFYSKDDAGRRQLGMPRIDKHIYSRENGLAIFALTAMYHATLDKKYLEQSVKAAQRITDSREMLSENGGFLHDERNEHGPYLGDTLMMARAFLRLYASTGDRGWLAKASASADFMEQNFKNAEAGYNTAVLPKDAAGVFQKPVRNMDENIVLVRFTNLLAHYTGNKKYRAMAEHGMRYLASPGLIENQNFTAGILLADRELGSEPIHVVVVGHKDDPAAKALFEAALHYPFGYKRLEWWDKREGAMPNPDVSYPELQEAAAFACAAKTCSLPVFKPERVAPQIDRLRKKKS